jgi:hypothetical protein
VAADVEAELGGGMGGYAGGSVGHLPAMPPHFSTMTPYGTGYGFGFQEPVMYMMPPPGDLLPELTRQQLDDVMTIASAQIEEFRILFGQILGYARTGTFGHAEIAAPGSDTNKLLAGLASRTNFDVHFEIGIDEAGNFTRGAFKGKPDVIWAPKGLEIIGKNADALILEKDPARQIHVFDWKPSKDSPLSKGLRSVLSPEAQKLVGKMGGLTAKDRDAALSRLSTSLGGGSAKFQMIKRFSKAFYILSLVAGCIAAAKKVKNAAALAKAGDYKGAATEAVLAGDLFFGISDSGKGGWKAGELTSKTKLRETLEFYGLPEYAMLFKEDETFGSLLESTFKSCTSLIETLDVAGSAISEVVAAIGKLKSWKRSYSSPLPW